MLYFFSQLFGKSYVIARMEVRKLLHDPMELGTRLVQPILWLGIFGQALNKVGAIPTEGLTYMQFITPGILAQSITFLAIFYGLSIVFERDLGILQKFLVTPTPRLALVWGKMVSAGVRGLAQAIVVFLFALILGVEIKVTLFSPFLVLLLVMLGAGFFASFSMIIAAIVKTRERFMGIGQLITLPLFFASNAIYPIEIMPSWLQVVAYLNPLSYVVSGLRAVLITGDLSHVAFDIGVLTFATFFISLLASKIYPKILT